MRIKAFIVLATLAATAMPAAAQGYGRSCQEVRASNQVGGALVGSILGGVFGSNIAASGHRDDGTVVGALVGGMIGAGVGGGATDCRPVHPPYAQGYRPGSAYNPNPDYGGPYYGDNYSYGYSGSPRDDGYSGYRYGADSRDRGYRRDAPPHHGHRPKLDGDSYGAYTRRVDFAGLGCKDATQVTRMPDGSELHRPVHVCQDPDTGEWRIVD